MVHRAGWSMVVRKPTLVISICPLVELNNIYLRSGQWFPVNIRKDDIDK